MKTKLTKQRQDRDSAVRRQTMGQSQRTTPHHLPGKRHSSKVSFAPHKQPLVTTSLSLTSCRAEAGSALTYIISTPPGVTEEDVCSLLDEESVVHSGSETESLLQGSLFGEVFL